MNKVIIISLLLLNALTACGLSKTAPSQSTDFPQEPTQIIATKTQAIDIGDGGLISGQPCASPCFFGIRIGETQLNQVIPILKDNGISPCTYFNKRIIVCGGQVNIGADSSTFIVNGVMFDPSISISVGEIVESYGNPSSAIVEVDNTGTPESPKLLAFLLWDSIKMMIELPELPLMGESIYVIKNTTEVRFIHFLDDASYSYGYPQPWKGYGEYKP